MKYYIIHCKDKFVGYTTNKNTLTHFLSMRDKKYSYTSLKSKFISKEILDSEEFTECELTYYQGYSLTDELPVFFYEIQYIDENLNNDLKHMYSSLDKLNEYIKYFKSNEKKSIKIALHYIQNMLEYVIDTDEPVYDEIIDIVTYFDTLLKTSK